MAITLHYVLSVKLAQKLRLETRTAKSSVHNMKRGFLLHNRRTDPGSRSQGVASTSHTSSENNMLSYEVMVQHASTLALFNDAPAVLWLCRYQERKEAVVSFQKKLDTLLLVKRSVKRMKRSYRVLSALQLAANRTKVISSTECALFVHSEQQHWTSHNH